MSEKFRMPVPGARVRSRLKCSKGGVLDGLDEEHPCIEHRRSLPPGKRKRCPGNCEAGTWLYPRYREPKDKKFPQRLHLHQGMDLGGKQAKAARDAKSPMPLVVSVVTGVVKKVTPLNQREKGGNGKLGLTIVVRESAPPHRWFLHAHLSEIHPAIRKGMVVFEQQELGRVGSTGNAQWEHPHLHFEVSLKPLPAQRGMDHETRPGEPHTARINPAKVLEELGPWGTQHTYLPTGRKVDPATIDAEFEAVELSSSAGYFPLGANNTWHGGVHLAADGVLVAPLDGKIVAGRLDADAARAERAFGSTNFILLRHDIPEPVFDALRVGHHKDEGPKLRPEPDVGASLRGSARCTTTTPSSWSR